MYNILRNRLRYRQFQIMEKKTGGIWNFILEKRKKQDFK